MSNITSGSCRIGPAGVTMVTGPSDIFSNWVPGVFFEVEGVVCDATGWLVGLLAGCLTGCSVLVVGCSFGRVLPSGWVVDDGSIF